MTQKIDRSYKKDVVDPNAKKAIIRVRKEMFTKASSIAIITLIPSISTAQDWSPAVSYSSMVAVREALVASINASDQVKSLCESIKQRKKGDHWEKTNGSYDIQSINIEIGASDFDHIANDIFKENVSVTEANSELQGPQCIEITQETSGVTIEFSESKDTTISNTVSSSTTTTMGASISGSYGGVGIDASYEVTQDDSQSTETGSGTSSSTTVTWPFNWNSNDGDYAVEQFRNNYRLRKSSNENVHYEIIKATTTFECKFKQSGSGITTIRTSDTVNVVADVASVLGSRLVRVGETMSFDVDYYDPWSSFRIVLGGSCQ